LAQAELNALCPEPNLELTMKFGIWIALTFAAANTPPTCESEAGDDAACPATSLLQLKTQAPGHDEGAGAFLALVDRYPKPWEDVCKGKNLTDDCSFELVNRKANTTKQITGKCGKAYRGVDLVCRPPPRPHPAVTVCKNHSVGDDCTYTHPAKGKMPARTITGKCAASSRDNTYCKKPSPPHPGVEACKDKKHSDKCSFVKDGKTHAGVCGKPFRGEGLACKMPVKEHPGVTACKEKTDKAACSFSMKIRGGKEKSVTGQCAKRHKGGGLACRPARKPHPAKEACNEKAAGAECSFAIKIRRKGEKTYTGKCGIHPKYRAMYCKTSSGGGSRGGDRGGRGGGDGGSRGGGERGGRGGGERGGSSDRSHRRRARGRGRGGRGEAEVETED